MFAEPFRPNEDHASKASEHAPRSACSLPSVPAGDRVQYRAEIWRALLREAPISQSASVLELCPGESEKIGRALQMSGFQGTIYLLEPCSELGVRVRDRYRELLPRADVRLVPLKLNEFLTTSLPRIDAVLANHPLDDLILGEIIPPSEWNAVWGGTYRSPGETLKLVNRWWEFLEANPERLADARQAVCTDILALKEKLDPELLAIYQYPSTTLRRAGCAMPDKCAMETLEMLRVSFDAKQDRWNNVLRRIDQSGSHWLISERARTLANDLRAKPEAIARLGTETFIALPAYADCPSDSIDLVIDEELAAKYADANCGAASALRDTLALDLSSDHSQDSTTTVYVDYQHDPGGIALGTNLGSGRAAYIGRSFNVKGIGRTPLVKSNPASVHGSGRLNLMKGGWEMMVANTIHHNFWSGGSAILGLGFHKRTFALKGQDWLAVKALREDRGSLDRPAHKLLTCAADARMDLRQFARDLGSLDAEQFIERIVHNAWSVANFSLAGQLIDFDTASAVRRRCPHFSYNAKYPAVLFGLESDGKKMALEIMLEDRRARHGESRDEVMVEFDKARSHALSTRILRLFGISGEETLQVRAAFDDILNPLTALFDEYARKMYPDFAALNLRGGDPSPAVFDFSRLFRYLPLLRQQQATSTKLREQGMKLLINTGAFTSVPCAKMSAACHEKLLASCVIANQTELTHCEKAAQRCVPLFCDLLDGIESLKLSSSVQQRALRAYRANEDRNYLMIGSMLPFLAGLDHQVQAGEVRPALVQRLINTFIAANDRRVVANSNGELVTDTEIFWEGVLSKVIRADGLVQDRFAPFPEHAAALVFAGASELTIESQNGSKTLACASQSAVCLSAPYSAETICIDVTGCTGKGFVSVAAAGHSVKLNPILKALP